MMEIIRGQVDLFRSICAIDQRVNVQFLAEHREILEKIRAGAAQETALLLEKHIRAVKLETLRLWPRQN